LEPDYDFLNLFGGDEETTVLAAGASLFAKGDAARTMFVVRSGAIDVHDGDIVLETVMPGGLLGEMAIVDGAPRSTGARASAGERGDSGRPKTLPENGRADALLRHPHHAGAYATLAPDQRPDCRALAEAQCRVRRRASTLPKMPLGRKMMNSTSSTP
jgi:hypothetical protein